MARVNEPELGLVFKFSESDFELITMIKIDPVSEPPHVMLILSFLGLYFSIEHEKTSQGKLEVED